MKNEKMKNNILKILKGYWNTDTTFLEHIADLIVEDVEQYDELFINAFNYAMIVLNNDIKEIEDGIDNGTYTARTWKIKKIIYNMLRRNIYKNIDMHLERAERAKSDDLLTNF